MRTSIFLANVLFFQTAFSQSWQPVSTGVVGGNFGFACVRAMTVYNNKLIVGGEFDNAGGNPAKNIAAWDGTNWSALGTELKCNICGIGYTKCGQSEGYGRYGWVGALAVYNNELYAGGQFKDANGVSLNCIAKWNGSSWVGWGWC